MGEINYLKIILDTVRFSLRHKDYDRTVDVRDFARMAITGADQDKHVTRYRRFEDDELQAQRKRLYNPRTPSALNIPRKHFRKLYKVEGIRINIAAPENEKARLMDGLHNIMPGKTLEMWLNEELEHLNAIDPNAWIVYERMNIERAGIVQGVKTYPVIFAAPDTLNFDIQAGVPKWAIFRSARMETYIENGVRLDRWLEDFYLYAPGLVIRLREIGQQTERQDGEETIELEVFPPAAAATAYRTPSEIEKAAIKTAYPQNTPVKRQFYLAQFDNGTTEVPAMPVGAFMDEHTDRRTFVTWFEPARYLVEDLIRDKVCLDVTIILHTYPKRTEFVKPCRFRDETSGAECVGGWLNDVHTPENMCPACHGSGKAANFTTEQKVLQLTMPENPEDMIELSKLSYEEPIDISFPDWLDKRIDNTEKQIIATIFSQGLYQKPNESKAKTATEVNAEQEGLSDVLSAFGAKYSQHFELAHRINAQYNEVSNFEVNHSFPQDIKSVTLSELLAEYEKIKDAAVGYDALAAQRSKVLEKLTEGSPEDRAWIEAKYMWLPFADKNDEGIAAILASRSPLDDDRVLWENFLSIFREIQKKYEQFPQMAYEAQKKIVAEQVAATKERIELAADLSPIDEPNNIANAATDNGLEEGQPQQDAA